MRNKRFVRGFAAFVIAVTFGSLAHAAGAEANAMPAADKTAAESCVGDATAPYVFYGSVPAAGFVDTMPSQVEIYQSSDITLAYLAQVENNVNGTIPKYTQDETDDPQFLPRKLEQARAFASMSRIAKIAPVIHTGQFLCRGFLPGRYEFFATVHVFAPTANSGGQKMLVTQYFRSTLEARPTRKGKLYLAVPGFRLVGQVPK